MEENSDWEKMLISFVGEQAAREIIASMKASGLDPQDFANASAVPNNPAQMMAMMQSFRSMLAPNQGPVNWQMTWDIARQAAHLGNDPMLTAAQEARIKQALTVADLWLDSVTDFAPPPPSRKAWSRVEWVNATAPTWETICTPVATNATRALAEAISHRFSEYDQPMPTLGGMMAGLDPAELVKRMASAVFASQIGQVIGKIAREALGSTDVSLPLQDSCVTALVAANVDEFGQDLCVPAEEVLQFVAVREAAHARLFGAVPWLRAHVLKAIEDYSGEITLDIEAVEDATRNIQFLDPTQLQQVTVRGIFSATPSPKQAKALEQLETTLAVIEGWVEVVTFQACIANLTYLPALQEMMRRRRATGSPSEELLGSLVGLQLRPRRAREASALWQKVGNELGNSERDKLWAHPDVMPRAGELDDPDNFLTLRRAQADVESTVDQELEKMLSGTLGWAEGLRPDSSQDSHEDGEADGEDKTEN